MDVGEVPVWGEARQQDHAHQEAFVLFLSLYHIAEYSFHSQGRYKGVQHMTRTTQNTGLRTPDIDGPEQAKRLAVEIRSVSTLRTLC